MVGLAVACAQRHSLVPIWHRKVLALITPPHHMLKKNFWRLRHQMWTGPSQNFGHLEEGGRQHQGLQLGAHGGTHPNPGTATLASVRGRSQ